MQETSQTLRFKEMPEFFEKNMKDKTRTQSKAGTVQEKTSKCLCLKLLERSKPTESEHGTLHGSAGTHGITRPVPWAPADGHMPMPAGCLAAKTLEKREGAHIANDCENEKFDFAHGRKMSRTTDGIRWDKSCLAFVVCVLRK